MRRLFGMSDKAKTFRPLKKHSVSVCYFDFFLVIFLPLTKRTEIHDAKITQDDDKNPWKVMNPLYIYLFLYLSLFRHVHKHI